jgi:hypothetical protein
MYTAVLLLQLAQNGAIRRGHGKVTLSTPPCENTSFAE